jgi:hypothetical protein
MRSTKATEVASRDQDAPAPADDPIPLSVLSLDLPALDRRHIVTVTDSIGRESVSREDARRLLAERRADEARQARKRAEVERQAIEADQAFRAQLARGIPATSVPAGVTAAELMMLSDPMDQGPRRESVLEHALEHAGGAVVFHPIRGEES